MYHTCPLHPPSAVVCAEFARSLTSNCCGPLAELSDHSWATTNVPSIVYVRPTSHSDTVENGAVIHSTGANILVNSFLAVLAISTVRKRSQPHDDSAI